jgi:hypothetical protein
MRGQVGDGERPASWVGAYDRLPEGLRTRRGMEDLAVKAKGESSSGVFVETHGQTRHEPYWSETGACDVRLNWTGQVGLGSRMREEDEDAVNEAVEVDVGVLLELASRAGDVVAMTGAQLTLGVTLDENRCSSARRVRKPRLAVQQT